MTVRGSSHRKRCGAAVAACAALSLVLVAAAQGLEPPAPGNLIANGGFDTGTAGWGSFNGTLGRSTNGSLCSTENPGAATVTRKTGTVYTISDSVGGNLPTVRSTLAREPFIAYATVSAASASSAGKPARIVLRERVGTTGAIVKETATSFRLPPAGSGTVFVLSAQAVRSGSTLGLRIEQSSAQPGDAFTVDDVFLRRPTRAWGSPTPGTIWTRMAGNLSRISTYSALGPDGRLDGMSRYLDRLRVYLDGRGGATGAQKLRAVVYEGVQFGPPVFRLATSREVTITSGMSARWVDFRFETPVQLHASDGAIYQFGLLSGPTGNVARYASTAAPEALWWAPDRYADGANLFFGTTDPNGVGATFSTDARQMSIQGIAAPRGFAHPESCF